MKILQVGPNSVHVSSFVSAIISEQNELFLLSEESCDFEGIKKNYVVSFRTINPIEIVRNNFKIKQILIEIQPDVIHIHQVNRLAFFVSRIARKLNIRVVTTAWGSDVLLVPKKNLIYRFLVKKSLQNSNVVSADSNDMIDAMKNLFPVGDYRLLQYGIDPIESAEKENIVYSNRLHEPLYRISQVINYFAEFIKSNPNWVLVIAGTGSETENLQKHTSDLKLDSKIKFVGWQKRDENRAWYAKSRIYISIPESDGTSVSVLEAMSAGCIPVVADLAVSHEWIFAGQNGIIEKKNQNPLEEAINLDAEKCSKTNLTLIKDKATRAASVRAIMQLYVGD